MTGQSNRFRITIEGVVIVASILFAFSLQAWWDDHGDSREEARLLNSLLREFRANGEHRASSVQYQTAIRASTQALLEVASDPDLRLSRDSVDTLISGVSWFAIPTRFETAALDAVILGGKLATFSDEDLRTELTAWLRMLERVDETVKQDGETYFQVWLPFLRTNSYLPQISNVLTQPGTGVGYYGVPVPVLPDPVDHRGLLRNREFQNILVQKRWVSDDILDVYRQVEPFLGPLVADLSAKVRDEWTVTDERLVFERRCIRWDFVAPP